MSAPLLRTIFLFTLLSSALAAGKSAPLFLPAVAPALVGLVLYAFSGIVHFIQFFRMGKPFMLPLAIGMITMAIGFVVRILVHSSPTSMGLNIVTTLLILLSPCLYLAQDYMILGRLAVLFGPEVSKKAMLIAPTRIATIFVWSDVVTFLIQAIGGAMSTSSTVATIDLGNTIVIAGLGVQLASFGLFTTLVISFGLRVRNHFPKVWNATGNQGFAAFSRSPVADWHLLYYTLCLSCVSILIRSIFRMAEFIQGHKGYISTHEAFFYCFDALPLWIAMTLYCAVWPPRFLHPRTAKGEEVELTRKEGNGYDSAL
ncbi:RTA1 like protein-domain-containing protein [Mycena vitilis]|nr:RTA1 like protein-domain-containing protein [Mycena vitilis]